MKKSLLALAVLGAFSGVASAQSSVTLYGTLDMNGRYVKADNQDRRMTMGTNGIASSQLGFRGIEDLGGGLKAGFILLADLAPIDSGNVGAKFFGRRATVSLLGGFG
jgi:predicted porin